MDGWRTEGMAVGLDGWMDGWRDGGMDGWMDGRRDGWKYGSIEREGERKRIKSLVVLHRALHQTEKKMLLRCAIPLFVLAAILAALIMCRS